jgi:hypothetical protein
VERKRWKPERRENVLEIKEQNAKRERNVTLPAP